MPPLEVVFLVVCISQIKTNLGHFLFKPSVSSAVCL